MRTLGYWVVDRVIEHLESLPDGPAIRGGSPAELWEALGGQVPEEGGSAQEALRTLADVALSHMQHGDHPRYFARVPGPSSYPGVLADVELPSLTTHLDVGEADLDYPVAFDQVAPL